GSVGTDEKIRVDESELAVAPESDLTAIDAGADDEVVVVTEHLVVVEGLQRGACRQRFGEGAVDGAPGRGRAVSAPRRARDRLVVLIEDLETRLRKACWKSFAMEAQGVEQRTAAALDLGGVAVDMLLVDYTSTLLKGRALVCHSTVSYPISQPQASPPIPLWLERRSPHIPLGDLR